MKRKFKKIKGNKFVPELKIHYKATRISKKPITDTPSAVKFLRKIFDKGTMDLQEETVLLLLDSENYPVGFNRVSKGTRYSCPVDHKQILITIMKSGVDRFILAHNHPGTRVIPSEEDIESANALRQMAKFLELACIDEIIISRKREFSLGDNGLFFE